VVPLIAGVNLWIAMAPTRGTSSIGLSRAMRMDPRLRRARFVWVEALVGVWIYFT
jgi:hypothetical protein